MDDSNTSITKQITVAAPIDVAWKVFTYDMGRWWPLDTHKIGAVRAVDAIVEPRAGGRWYERGEDGSACDWGRVLAWEPPNRLVMSWEITPEWKHDPTLVTEVEINFAPTASGTQVILVHRHLDRYGARAAEMIGIFASPGGWDGLLSAYAKSTQG
jgi:uncharacterized protein YndB with AHSA1/START domain